MSMWAAPSDDDWAPEPYEDDLEAFELHQLDQDRLLDQEDAEGL